MKILKLFLLATFFLSLPQLFKHEFKLPPPHPEIGFNPAWEVPLPNPEVRSILSQSFTYLAHGNQATVFESEDGQYVLKLFRYSRSRFPLIQTLKCWAAQLSGKRAKNDLFTKANKTFTAAHIATTEASSFTQALFCHLNLTDHQLPTTQFKAHRTYSLPLDRYRFVLQRKVTPFKEALLSARNDPEKLGRLIHSFVTLIQERSAQGIRNSDPNLAPNFGFLNEQAVEIDFGNYRKPPYNPEQRAAEISGYLTRLDHWLQRNIPEYSLPILE